MDSLSAAVRDVMGGIPVTVAARNNGVPRTTLRWRLQAEERAAAGKRATGTVKAALCLYDIHMPHDEWPHLMLAVEYAKARHNITHVILGGDILDCEGISRFAKGPDTMPLHEEIADAVYKLGKLRDLFPAASWTYVKGNHEHRLQAYLWNKAVEIAALKGLTIPEQLELDRLGITWVDNDALKQRTGHYYSFGKLNVLHGHELGICPRVNPAYKYLQRAKASIMVGHVHKLDTATDRTVDDVVIGCECVGTLANLRPAYRPQNDWVAGFAVVELDADGYYRVDNRKIIDGRIV